MLAAGLGPLILVLADGAARAESATGRRELARGADVANLVRACGTVLPARTRRTSRDGARVLGGLYIDSGGELANGAVGTHVRVLSGVTEMGRPASSYAVLQKWGGWV